MDDVEGKRLYVGNVQFSVTERELRDTFAEFVAVESVEIVKDKYTEQSRGFGFVTLVMESDAAAAIENLNGKTIRGRALRVAMAQPKPAPRNRGIDDYRRDDRLRGRH